MATEVQTFKLKLLGDGGVGKTTWVHKCKVNEFNKKYVRTIGAEAHPIGVHTNHGWILLTIYDYGDREYAGNPVQTTDATILMFDLTRKSSHTDLGNWFAKCGANEAVFVVGNKSDSEIKVTEPNFAANNGLPYMQVSAKTTTCKELFEPILRRLTGHTDLVCVDSGDSIQ